MIALALLMPYTANYAFDLFFENINLPGDHRSVAADRRERIISLLKNDFDILDSFATGSIPAYTALKAHADLDIMVVLHYSKHVKGKTPSEILAAVQQSLAEYRTGVRRNGQAVTLYYNSWPNVDVVPVSRTVNKDGSVNHYNVPDMNTEQWIMSRPRTHSNALEARNGSYGSEFKKIIKMIKWWNLRHSSLLRSYHIEAIALNVLDGKFSDYSWEVLQFFDKACQLIKGPLWHETGLADDYLDWEGRQEILKRLSRASEKATAAWHATYMNNCDEEKAINLWREIFGDKFPSYG